MWKQFVSGVVMLCVLLGLFPAVSLRTNAADGLMEYLPEQVEIDTADLVETEDVESTVHDPLGEDAQLIEISPEELHSYYKTLPKTRNTSGDPYEDILELMAVEEALVESILRGESLLSIREYSISEDNGVLPYLEYYSPYINDDINISIWSNGDIYTQISIRNNMSMEETKAYFSEVQQKLRYVEMLVQEGSSDLEKALILHDYMIQTYQYDMSYSYYRSGDMLMKETGVCNAYTYLYMYVMNQVGMECYATHSSEMNHCWNIVRIGEDYYHVDVTWDDPIPDRLGRVKHGCFLVSDSAIQLTRNNSSKTHYAWNRTDLVCDDESYDVAYWTDIPSQIVHSEGSQYYIKDSNIIRRNPQTAEEEVIKTFKKWYVWESTSSYWRGAYTGLFELDGYLYCNTSESIIRISIEDGQETVYYTPDTSNGRVFGSALQGNHVAYVISQSPNEAGEVFTVPEEISLEARGVFLNETTATIHIGEAYQLMAYVIPAEANVQPSWESSQPEVVAVDASGLATAVSPGEAVVSVFLPNGVSAQCVVKVCQDQVFTVKTEPTADQEGSIGAVCDNCGREENVVLPKLNTTDYTYSVVNVATCTEVGVERYTWNNSTYGTFYFDFEIAKDSHDYLPIVTHPTCTEAGYTTYTCSKCGDSYTGNPVAATGHSYTYTNNGDNHTVGCSRCDYSVTEDHSFTNGACICGAVEATEPEGPIPASDLKFINKSLSLQSYIAFNVLASKSTLSNYDSWYVVFERYDYEKNEVVTQTVEGTVYMNNYWQFEYKLNSYHMSDNVTATLYAVKDGKTYVGETYVNSAADYVIGSLPKASSDAHRKVFADLLTYGAKAQIYMGYNVEKLADADLGEYASFVTTTDPTAESIFAQTDKGLSGVTLGRMALGIASSVELQAILKVSSGYVAEDLYAEMVYVSGGKTMAQRIEGENFQVVGGGFCVAVFNALTATDGRTPVEITVYDAEGNVVSETWTYSIASYLDGTALTGNALNTLYALINFYDSAAVYYNQ